MTRPSYEDKKNITHRVDTKVYNQWREIWEKTEGQDATEKMKNIIEILCVRESERELAHREDAQVSSSVPSHSPQIPDSLLAPETHDCKFLTPFVKEDELHCMKEFNRKGRIIKIHPIDCYYCFQKGIVPEGATKPLSEEEKSQRKREQFRKATTNVGLQSGSKLSKKWQNIYYHDPMRESKAGGDATLK